MTKNDDTLTQGEFTPTSLSPPWWQAHRSQLISFAVLILLLLGVVFLLPEAVQPEKTDSLAKANTPAPISGKKQSPWSEAQTAKQRKEAQTVLSDILKIQQTLEEQSVERWAPESYQDAMNTAAEGDGFYRLREFSQAQKQYQLSRTKFEALASSADSKFTQLMNDGATAIDEGNASAATQAFELAGLIQANSLEAQNGLQQAQSLDRVLAQLNDAVLQQKTGNLDAALTLTQQALDTDANSKPAKNLLVTLNASILERDFTNAMSKGYAALQSASYAKAKSAFKSALALKPSSSDAKAALTQAGNQQTQTKIEALLAEAKTNETKEQWQTAEDTYEKALKLDASLVSARIGLIRSQARNQLDQQLVTLLAEPERLASDAVYKQGRRVLKDARGLSQTAPKLQTQVQSLSALLAKAKVPLEVVLRSDQQTDVTVYKVGRLGLFDKHHLSLAPGNYVAVGKREGYRDVRQEFTVLWDKPAPNITIQCEEPIASL